MSISWFHGKPPIGGLEENSPYLDLMKFEPAQTSEILGPLITEQVLSDVPIFGPEKTGIADRISDALKIVSPYLLLLSTWTKFLGHCQIHSLMRPPLLKS
ncbi:hypothetical protein J3459_007391 [Metarhizium acridum]|nr:hypothetical protein J3459_007391 [Metarhizium acridum]